MRARRRLGHGAHHRHRFGPEYWSTCDHIRTKTDPRAGHQSKEARPIWMSIRAACSSAVRGHSPLAPTGSGRPSTTSVPTGATTAAVPLSANRRGAGRSTHAFVERHLALLDRPPAAAGQAEQRIAGDPVQVGVGQRRRQQVIAVDQHDVRRPRLLELPAQREQHLVGAVPLAGGHDRRQRHRVVGARLDDTELRRRPRRDRLDRDRQRPGRQVVADGQAST